MNSIKTSVQVLALIPVAFVVMILIAFMYAWEYAFEND